METIFENIVNGLEERDFVVTDELVSPELWRGLRDTLIARKAQDQLHMAGIGNRERKARNAEIRRDKILWLDEQPKNEFERQFMELQRDLAAYLNRTCYTGIWELEFHYACYEPGAFYKRHLDRFRSDNARKFSVISYLNEDWQPGDGGELVMYLEDGPRRILPIGGTTVFFRSDVVEHEVLVAHRERLSLTGWMR